MLNPPHRLPVRRAVLASVALLVTLLASTAVARADSVTWVEGANGDDANACTRIAPCKTFALAMSHTDAGGTIRVLSPGSYGAVTITKALTIDADSTYAGVLAGAGQNAIIVNAPGADVV